MLLISRESHGNDGKTRLYSRGWRLLTEEHLIRSSSSRWVVSPVTEPSMLWHETFWLLLLLFFRTVGQLSDTILLDSRNVVILLPNQKGNKLCWVEKTRLLHKSWHLLWVSQTGVHTSATYMFPLTVSRILDRRTETSCNTHHSKECGMLIHSSFLLSTENVSTGSYR